MAAPSSNPRPGGAQSSPPHEAGSEGLRGRLRGRRAAAVRDSDSLFEPSLHYQDFGRRGAGVRLQLQRASDGALRHRRFRAGEMAHRQRKRRFRKTFIPHFISDKEIVNYVFIFCKSEEDCILNHTGHWNHTHKLVYRSYRLFFNSQAVMFGLR